MPVLWMQSAHVLLLLYAHVLHLLCVAYVWHTCMVCHTYAWRVWCFCPDSTYVLHVLCTLDTVCSMHAARIMHAWYECHSLIFTMETQFIYLWERPSLLCSWACSLRSTAHILPRSRSSYRMARSFRSGSKGWLRWWDLCALTFECLYTAR